MLKLPSCELRPWRVEDTESLQYHANNRKVWLNLRDRFPHPFTEQDASDWVSLVSSQSPVLHMAIDVGDRAVGGIGIELQSDVHRLSGEIGYWLGEEFWGRGIMTEAVRAMTAYAVDTLGLLRVFAEVFDSNPASAHVLEKAGYAFEGRKRRSVIKDGVVRDQLLYAHVVDRPWGGESSAG